MFRKIGVMTLGISFIATGLVFLLNPIMNYSIVHILRIIWPCIFIAFGIECVVSYTLASKKENEHSLKISYGSIFVILMLCSFIGLISSNLIYFDIEDGLDQTFRIVVENIEN